MQEFKSQGGVAKERIDVEVRKLLELEGFPQPRMGRKEEDHSKIYSNIWNSHQIS